MSKLSIDEPQSEDEWKIQSLASSLIDIEKAKKDKKLWSKIIKKANEIIKEKKKDVQAGEAAIRSFTNRKVKRL